MCCLFVCCLLASRTNKWGSANRNASSQWEYGECVIPLWLAGILHNSNYRLSPLWKTHKSSSCQKTTPCIPLQDAPEERITAARTLTCRPKATVPSVPATHTHLLLALCCSGSLLATNIDALEEKEHAFCVRHTAVLTRHRRGAPSAKKQLFQSTAMASFIFT